MVFVPPLLTFLIKRKAILSLPQDQIESREQLYRIKSTMSFIFTILAVLNVIFYDILFEMQLPCSFWLFSAILLVFYLLVLVSYIISWGIIYRRTRRLAYRMVDFLKFNLVFALIFRGITVLGIYFVVLEIFLMSNNDSVSFFIILPIAIAITLFISFFSISIGRWFGAITVLPKEQVVGGFEHRFTHVRRLNAMKTYGVPFANAFAFTLTREIVVSDTLISNFDPNIIKSVLLHEAGHLATKSESVFRVFNLIFVVFMFLFFIPLLNLFEGLGLVFAGLVLFIFLFVIERVGRSFEKHADAFAAQSPELTGEYANALQKTYDYNWLPMKVRFGKDKESHPTLQNRFKELGQELKPNEAEEAYLNRTRGRQKINQAISVAGLVFILIAGLGYNYYRTHYTPYQKAMRYFALGDFQKSAEEFTKVVARYPDNPLHNYNLATAYARLRRWDDAKTELKKALAKDPDYEASKKLLRQIDDYLSQ